MKILLVSLFILSSSLGHAQTSEAYLEEISGFEQYKESIDRKEQWLFSLKKEISKYDHKNMISKDQKLLDQSIKKIKLALIDIGDKKQTFFLNKAKKQVSELKVIEDYINDYETKQKRIEAIKQKTDLTKRFKKYLSLLEKGKYTQAKILMALLPKREKELAKEYDDTRGFLIREENYYQAQLKDIKKKNKAIEKTLSFSRNSKATIDNAVKVGWSESEVFQSIKEAHQKAQLDVTFGEYESGMFNCKPHSEPKFLGFKNFPDLIALSTRGQVNSIIKIDPQQPNKKEFIYKCSEYSGLGICIENRKKGICKIHAECAEALGKMEASFDMDKEFRKNKNDYINHLFNNTKKDITTHPGNPIFFWQEKGELGEFTVEGLVQEFQQFIDEAKNYKDVPLEKLVSYMTSKAQKTQKQKMLQYKKDPEKKIMEYLYNSIKGFFSDLEKRDPLQVYIGNRCHQGQFCSDYKAWDKATQVFDEKEEIENLTEEECPRLVLRFDSNNKILDSYRCGQGPIPQTDLNNILNLNLDSQKIINKVK